MKIKQHIANEFIFEQSKSETAYYVNILNEIQNGIRVENFEAQVGGPTKRVRRLRDKLDKTYCASQDNDELQEIRLSKPEIEILCRASSLCIDELGEEEFSTRLGESIPFALELIDFLKNYLT